jgi:hypothetical protein
MFNLTPATKIFVYAKPIDMRKSFGTPGKAWRLQRVKFPPQKEARATSLGIESWAHGGKDMSQV